MVVWKSESTFCLVYKYSLITRLHTSLGGFLLGEEDEFSLLTFQFQVCRCGHSEERETMKQRPLTGFSAESVIGNPI